MKEMFNTIREVYKEDKKEFFESIIGVTLVFVMMWFLLWFQGTFCYDM